MPRDSAACRSLLPWFAVLMALVAAPLGAQNGPTQVDVVSPQAASGAPTRQLSGSVGATRHAALSPRLSGLVAQLRVDAGARVARGDRLLHLDDTLARLELATAEAALQAARVQQADAERIEAESRPLLAQGLLPASQGDSLRAQLAVARANAAARAAEAALWRERLDRHWLTAPFAGVVVARHVDPGEWVDPGSAVLTLVDLDDLHFDARAPQEWYTQLDLAAAVRVRIDGRDDALDGLRILAAVPASEPGSRSFLLRIALPAQQPALLPGASGQVELPLRGEGHAYLLPRDAVQSNPDGGHSVWLAQPQDGGHVARSRRIEVASTLADPVQVLDGLDGSEQVILRGFSRLRDGDPVAPAAP